MHDLVSFHNDSPLGPAFDTVELEVVEHELPEGVFVVVAPAVSEEADYHAEKQEGAHSASVGLAKLPLLEDALIEEYEVFELGVLLQSLLDLLQLGHSVELVDGQVEVQLVLGEHKLYDWNLNNSISNLGASDIADLREAVIRVQQGVELPVQLPVVFLFAHDHHIDIRVGQVCAGPE